MPTNPIRKITQRLEILSGASLTFGSSKEYSVSYDSAANAINITDTVNDKTVTIDSASITSDEVAVDGASFAALSSAPSSPSAGDVALADGTNWDPDGDGNAEKVIYNGTSWVEDVDLGTAL